jgi:hypothetical protein
MQTPAFLIWALEYRCPIRSPQDGSDPERTERQLRAARAVSDARREGRVFEGLCLDPPHGFRITDALAIYGGLSAVERACSTCPANALARLAPDSLTGCFSMLPLKPDERAIHETMDNAIDQLGATATYERLFMPTEPRWYGLWMRSPLVQEQVDFLLAVVAQIKIASIRPAFAELQAGLRAAIDSTLPLHVALYPRGRVEGTSWLLDAHCPRCKGSCDTLSTKQCDVCGYVGHAAPDKKRKARGRRPYFPLDRLLGEEAAAEFLVRYETFREQQQSQAPAQNPPRGARSDSPRAG